MFTDAMELIKYRQELVNGGFTSDEAFELISAYYEAKLDARANDGIVYLANEQDAADLERLDGPSDG